MPKIDVLTFNGDILTWWTFWEQFNISVHTRTVLPDQEKLVHLQQSLKDGLAKHTIEGLSRSEECCMKAIQLHKARYDKPRLIHQAHVRLITEVPILKDGSSKELPRLHDVV